MKMKHFTLLVSFLFALMGWQAAQAQGCVAIRGGSSCSLGAYTDMSNTVAKGEFSWNSGFRYFKSFRHFRGSEEETYRVAEGTEVINHSFFLDFSLQYGISDRVFASAVLPFVFHNRSSMYEHGGNPPNGLGERHQTSSRGLADVRLGVGYWLFDPKKHHSFNYGLSLGVKLPTGQYDYTDTFYNQGENKDQDVEKVVDQSIQPGDGGTGLTADVQGFHALSSSVVLSTNLFYLFNFQESNGVLTRNGNSEFSCPDQFGVRIGAFFNTKFRGFNTYLGGRFEGVPANDLVGGSAGYRRPGYALSVEPGIGYNWNMYAINLSVPVALVRNRTRSYEDKQRTLNTGVYRHGDAAFADYLISLNFSYRLLANQNPGH